MAEPAEPIPTLDELAAITVKAGELTLQHFRTGLDVSEKAGDQGVVTQADFASESLIKSFITERFPGHLVLAEESAAETVLPRLSGNQRKPIWIIDPLDGTTNFSKGHPYYNVSVGFGFLTATGCEMELGAIFQPTTRDLYTGQRSRGSWCNGEPLRAPGNVPLRLCTITTGFSSNKGADLRRVCDTIYEFQNRILGLRINGAAALDMALCARGICQGFYEERLAPWDMAAGSVIATEAGCIVTNLEGAPLDAVRDRHVICAPPALHAEMLKIIRRESA